MTAMAWQPEEEPLRQLSSCLKDSLSGHNKTAQKQAETVSGFCRDPFVATFLYYENSC
jgi:transportin-1